MPTRLRANRKKRGHRTVGYGRIGQHRKHPSGRGNAGGQHHHRIWMDKYHPGYFGKVGMRHFHFKKNASYVKSHKPCVNICDLTAMIPEEDKKQATGAKLPVLNLTSRGIFKVLGKGRLSAPCIIKARFVSRIAERKVKQAGGAVVLTA
eukprot:TRINITY_DN1082_c0_g1_i1.p2 TRINITY_DN1082_c0_g1~~TRINITY_DN1082_c0_g1_i1.p2  ORF type:complete len:149 (+),score=57.56 TRINITY_DN1082_c0_g1_i1:107-553(+)